LAAKARSDVKCEPNLTAMLDVVFQLMTFFLMVMNFSQDDYDVRVRLPVAGSARPVELPKEGEDRLVLNIDRDGHLLIAGQSYDTERAIKEIRTQSQLIRLNAKVAGKEIKPGATLPTTLVIRGDRATPFGQLYRLITACQNFGFKTFALKAQKDSDF
jgi:biopolymer transport protein ExbD